MNGDVPFLGYPALSTQAHPLLAKKTNPTGVVQPVRNVYQRLAGKHTSIACVIAQMQTPIFGSCNERTHLKLKSPNRNLAKNETLAPDSLAGRAR